MSSPMICPRLARPPAPVQLQYTVRGVSLRTAGLLLLTGLLGGWVLLFSDWWLWLRLGGLAPLLVTVLLQAPYQGQTAGAQLRHALRFYRTRSTRQLKAGWQAHRKAAQTTSQSNPVHACRRGRPLRQLQPASSWRPPPRPRGSGLVMPKPTAFRDMPKSAPQASLPGATVPKVDTRPARGRVLRSLEWHGGPQARLPVQAGSGSVAPEAPWLL